MTDEEKAAVDALRQTIDPSQFSVNPYVRRINKPWGYEIHFTPDNLPYMGKLIYLDEAKRSSLQLHDKKQESWFWLAGNPIIEIEAADGLMKEIVVSEGVGYSALIGQKHRLKGGKGGGALIEVSTPERGTTYRLEDDFERASENDNERHERNQNAG